MNSIPSDNLDGHLPTNMPDLVRIINDPRGPEKILPALTAGELAVLIDTLYRNLDTPEPEIGAESWYELAVEEDVRRSPRPGDEVRGAV